MQRATERTHGRLHIVLGLAGLVLGGIYWAGSRTSGEVADPGAGVLEGVAQAPRPAVEPRAADDGSRPSIEPRAADAANARAPAEPDPEAHDDPLDRLPASDRLERHQAELERVLAELEDPTRPAAAHERLRLEAAATLTRLRPELGTSPEGERQLLGYAARFRATASP